MRNLFSNIFRAIALTLMIINKLFVLKSQDVSENLKIKTYSTYDLQYTN